jgi:hypothetical protein
MKLLDFSDSVIKNTFASKLKDVNDHSISISTFFGAYIFEVFIYGIFFVK